MTARFVAAVAHTDAIIVDTRKTTPGLRVLDKYAVRMGGGQNHRTSLYDGVLIKENHIAAAGGISAAVAGARRSAPHTLKIEVEAETMDDVREALEAGADIIMLDNMSLDQMKEAVELIGERALTEASGGVNLDTVADIAATGVDLISVGALTHSSGAVDISMLFR
jgi:nicotinate-nucleotide pyrophosphorylase (carboxylating)